MFFQRDELFDVDVSEGRKKRQCTLNRKFKFEEKTSDDEFDEDSSDVCQTISQFVTKETGKTFMAQIRMSNPMMLYKRVINHAYLVHFPVVPGTRDLLIDEGIIEHSGKMRVLDAMLAKLKQQNHKVT